MAIEMRSIKEPKEKINAEILISEQPISFLGGVDPKTGIVIDKESSAYGKNVKDKIFIFPRGKGSTVGSYVMLQLKKQGNAPAAIINEKVETIIAVGSVISDIPLFEIDKIQLELNGKTAIIENNVLEVE